MRQDVRDLLDSIQATVNSLESHDFSDSEVNILEQLKFQAERSVRWIVGRPVSTPMPTIDTQELERELWPLVARNQPTTVRGVAID